ncbi:MAG: WecB/TagA/CpsF family glycosyltransferase [Bacilli bacterium]|nr:WecB/TagA/CpsF family glycosyltransferase [Bacilli bacterium]
MKDYIKDIPVDNKSYEDILLEIKDAIKNNQKYTIFSINPKKIMHSMQDEKLKKGLINASAHIPDGMLVVKKCKYINKRVTGVDLMNKICENCHDINGKIFFYGAKKEVVEKLNVVLKEKYPNITISGYIDGYSDSDKVINAINKSKANILFVAMGSPKQELWVIDNIDNLNVNVIMGVGGSFDVLSGTKKRAPKFFTKLNLEWLYRMVCEPKRMKELPLYLKFLFTVKRDK